MNNTFNDYFRKLAPDGATHVLLGDSGVKVLFMKLEGGVWKVHQTDNDGEYPGWLDVANVFFYPDRVIAKLIPF